MKQIIHIFGASGSGTSTLGQAIRDALGYRWMDTDDYFWLPSDPPYTQKRPIDERLRMMRADMENAGNVVISGSLVDWGDALIPLFTLAVRLETATQVRIERLKQREKAAFGRRIEVGGDMYQKHADFLKWAAAYDTGGLETRSRAKHDAWQRQLRCPLLVLDGGDDPGRNLSAVRDALRQSPPVR